MNDAPQGLYERVPTSEENSLGEEGGRGEEVAADDQVHGDGDGVSLTAPPENADQQGAYLMGGVGSTLKLIAAIDALRSVIADSTGQAAFASPASRSRQATHSKNSKPMPGFSIPGQEFGEGERSNSDVPMKLPKAMSMKDERLKIRKDKVQCYLYSVHPHLVCFTISTHSLASSDHFLSFYIHNTINPNS